MNETGCGEAAGLMSEPKAALDAPGRILIVDDVADNRAVLSRRFQKRGFEIVEAHSGHAALEAIAGDVFDAVLLDVMMPDMDGMEVLKRIREHHSELALPVIMVTGRTESQNIVEALSAGANDYIVKPVDFAVALLRVSTQVGRRRAEEQLRLANEALSQANSDLERRIAERTQELVDANGQLRTAMEQAQAANRAKDEFLASMSHELRTPLNGLMPMAALLSQSTLTDAQHGMVGIIKTSADSMFDLISDLLDTLDLNVRGIELAPSRMELETAVREAAERPASRAAQKGLAFTVDVEASAKGHVETDSHRFKQVVAKLLDNAVKFTEAGEVALSLSRALAAPDRLVLEVRDTGVGFDEATAERLFKPFEQSDGSLTRRFGGAGVGLTIIQRIVELMDGDIAAKGTPGSGAVFRVELPLPAVA
jgi:signal transduction histidine kinase